MSAHYQDAGSGPHDPDSKVNARGERNCGCVHDGHTWLRMCATASAAWQGVHFSASVDDRHCPDTTAPREEP